jgi:hypothetical protein
VWHLRHWRANLGEVCESLCPKATKTDKTDFPLFEISLADRFDQPRSTGYLCNVLMVVDATECPIERPKEKEEQEFFYSGKKKKHTIKYEVAFILSFPQCFLPQSTVQVAVRVSDGLIVWISDPAPGKAHDLTIYRHYGLKTLLEPGERVLGDKGYQGDQTVITPYRYRMLLLPLNFSNSFASYSQATSRAMKPFGTNTLGSGASLSKTHCGASSVFNAYDSPGDTSFGAIP